MKISGIKNKLFDSFLLKNRYLFLKDKQEEYEIYIKGSKQAIESIKKGKGFSEDYNKGIEYYKNSIKKYKLLSKFSKIEESFFKHFLDIKEPKINISYTDLGADPRMHAPTSEEERKKLRKTETLTSADIDRKYITSPTINYIINEFGEKIEIKTEKDLEKIPKEFQYFKSYAREQLNNDISQENNIELS